MRKTIGFLRDLRRHNDREWFTLNRDRYLAAKEEGETLAGRLIDAIAGIDPAAAGMRVADCTYRIYRDTRFSADKTPYKTHYGIFVNPPFGKKSMLMGYYLHIEPGASFICGGNIGHPGPVLRAIRRSIADNTEEYLSIIRDPAFAGLLPHIGEDPLTTAPAGFRRDWEHIDLVRPRNFIASSGTLPDNFITAPDLVGRLLPYLVQIKRFNDFMNFTIEDFLPPSQRR